ncbi:MAG: Ig-like domain-containing protein [Sarcina sp.]
MKKKISMFLALALATSVFNGVSALATEKNTNAVGTNEKTKEIIKNESRKIDFTKDWKFNLGDVNGASGKDFDDSTWRGLNLPHDWSIELDFNPNSPSTHEGGYLDGGTAWYRKTFTLDESMKGKQISIDFDGVYMESELYVNGQKVGEYQNGYTPFSFDIEDKLNFDGEENVIAVKVVNRQPSSRWYSGSGIYRDVNLTVTNEINVERYGTFVTTPTLEEDLKGDLNANVNVKTKVNNESKKRSEAFVKSKIYSPNGELVTEHESVEVLKKGINEIEHNLDVYNPTLWGVYEGNLYKVVTEITIGGEVVDSYETTFGFRYFEFDENKGFLLNGEKTMLNGVCMHHDQGSLGAVANTDAIERQIDKLIEMGVNSIRVTHNPAASEFLRLCDEKGILVIEEAFDSWNQSKKPYDYGRFFNRYAERDIKQMIERGKNNPSIFMWSIGNEIYDTDTSNGVEIAKNLVKWIKEVDTTRPTTIGEDKYRGGKVDGVPNWNVNRDRVFDAVDVVGYNYSENVYDVHHEAKPDWKMYGAEISSAVRSRGIYLDPSNPNINDWENLQTSSYDNSFVGWGRTAEDSTKRHRDREYMAGQYIWTGFDYIGEPTPFYNSFPAKSSYFGAIDTAGFEKDIFYFYQSQWTQEPMVHLLPHWNWENGDTIELWAYSNVDTVELFLNGESLGERKFENLTTDYGMDYLETSDGKLHLEWSIPFTEGTLKAVAKKDGQIVAEDEITTAKEPAAVKMNPEKSVIKSDEKALAYIEVDVVDENGVFVPTADNLIEFEVEGGTIVGVDNGNAASVERYKDNKRKAFSGKALVIVQADDNAGEIIVNAKSKGLKGDQTTVIKVESTDDIEDQIVGFESVKTTVLKGEKVELPGQVTAIYGNGEKELTNVTWEDFDDAIFESIGEYIVTGTVEGTDLVVKATIVVKDIIDVKDYSTVTAVGEAPVLPSETSIIYSDGSENGVAVIWEEIDPSNYENVGEYVVNGAIEGYENLTAKAYIRVTDDATRENVALATSTQKGKAFASRTGNGDYVSHVNDSIVSYNNNPKNRWTNWPSAAPDHVGIKWEKEQKIDNMNLYIYADSGCAAPADLNIEYFDGTNWVAVNNIQMTPQVPTDNTKHEIIFDEVVTKKIRVNMNPQPNKSLALTEIEVFANVIKSQDIARLDDISINGETIDGFDKETLNYEVTIPYGANLPEIEATTASNGTVVIIPPTKLPGEAKLNVTAENGVTKETYTIKFVMEKPYLSNVEISTKSLNVNEDDVVTIDINASLISGENIDINKAKVEYFSSDIEVADFRDGKIAIVGGGSADVYVEVEYDNKKVKSNTLTLVATPQSEGKIIVGINPVILQTKVGEVPSLPTHVDVKFNAGLDKKKAVNWEEVQEDSYNKVGVVEVFGTIEGTAIKAKAVVNVVGTVSIENVSTATLIGEQPTLPEEITVYSSDDAQTKMPVVWNELSDDEVSTLGTYVVEGTIEGLQEKALASVRVSDESEKGLNISRFQNGYDYPRVSASYSNEPPFDPASNDRLAHVNNDIISFTDAPHDRWTNWKRTPDKDGWVAVEFGRVGPTEYYVNEMTVHYYTDHGVYVPQNAKVQYKKDGEWLDVENQVEKQGEFENSRVYNFDKVKASEMRIFMEAVSGKSLGITELQIFKDDVIKKENIDIKNVLLDGTAMSDFDENTTSYDIKIENGVIPAIKFETESNNAVTIVEAVTGISNKTVINSL